jgi:hypothetical protein
MSEQEQVQDTAPSEPALEDVYKQFNVEGVAKSFNVAPQPEPAQPAYVPPVPDPALDVDGFQKWAGQIQTSDAEMKQTLRSVSEQLSQFTNAQQTREIEADIKSAISKLQEKVDVDPELLESVLDARARRDEKFRAVWENRKDKPDVLDAALNALGSEISKKFSVRTDPQLAENTRAMKASRDQMSTTRKSKPNEEWEGLSEADYQRKWDQLVRG